MNHILIKNWLQNPSAITKNDAEEIKEAIIQYPYFAALKVLLAKAENGAPQFVKSAAAYVSHRPSLQAFLDTSFDTNINLPNTNGIEIESDEIGTLDKLSSEQPPFIPEEETPNEDSIEDISLIEQEINAIDNVIEEIETTSLNTEQENISEEQILKDLENTEEQQVLTNVEEQEITTSNSIADEVLAELAKMSEGRAIAPIDKPADDTTSVDDITLEEEEVNITTDIDPEETIVSSDEMLNRFQGFLNTRKKGEAEILDELTQEGSELDIFELNKNIAQNSYVVSEDHEEVTFDNKVVPIYDIELPDDVTNDQNYENSNSSMSDDNIIDHKQFNPESELSSQQKIIDEFIKDSPTITPLSKENEDTEHLDDLSEIENSDNLTPKTESFAKMLAKQGKKEDAISIYQHLILKNPNKATFFAERIEFLRKN